MSVLVKICGITNLDDAENAVECGADFLGFNFYPDSPRYLQPDRAKEILKEIPPAVSKVGIFVNAPIETAVDIAVGLDLDYLQFHGDETPEYCNAVGRPWYKAFGLKDESVLESIPQYKSEWVMVDAYVEKAFGGSGVVANWDLALRAKAYGKLILAGGLRSDNVEIAVKTVKPFAIDVASGVETSPGIKDHDKVEEFIRKAKGSGVGPRV